MYERGVFRKPHKSQCLLYNKHHHTRAMQICFACALSALFLFHVHHVCACCGSTTTYSSTYSTATYTTSSSTTCSLLHSVSSIMLPVPKLLRVDQLLCVFGWDFYKNAHCICMQNCAYTTHSYTANTTHTIHLDCGACHALSKSLVLQHV